MDILRETHDFLIAELETGRPSLAPDENLLAQGLLDSMGMLKLVTFLEERFGVQVADDDLVPENFSTLDSIRTYVERKRK